MNHPLGAARRDLVPMREITTHGAGRENPRDLREGQALERIFRVHIDRGRILPPRRRIAITPDPDVGRRVTIQPAKRLDLHRPGAAPDRRQRGDTRREPADAGGRTLAQERELEAGMSARKELVELREHGLHAVVAHDEDRAVGLHVGCVLRHGDRARLIGGQFAAGGPGHKRADRERQDWKKRLEFHRAVLSRAWPVRPRPPGR